MSVKIQDGTNTLKIAEVSIEGSTIIKSFFDIYSRIKYKIDFHANAFLFSENHPGDIYEQCFNIFNIPDNYFQEQGCDNLEDIVQSAEIDFQVHSLSPELIKRLLLQSGKIFHDEGIILNFVLDHKNVNYLLQVAGNKINLKEFNSTDPVGDNVFWVFAVLNIPDLY